MPSIDFGDGDGGAGSIALGLYMVNEAIAQLKASKVRSASHELAWRLACLSIVHATGSRHVKNRAHWIMGYVLGHISEQRTAHETWLTEDGLLALDAMMIIAATARTKHRQHFALPNIAYMQAQGRRRQLLGLEKKLEAPDSYYMDVYNTSLKVLEVMEQAAVAKCNGAL